MSLQPNGPAPYTTVSAFTTVIDWFRDGGSAPEPSTPIRW